MKKRLFLATDSEVFRSDSLSGCQMHWREITPGSMPEVDEIRRAIPLFGHEWMRRVSILLGALITTPSRANALEPGEDGDEVLFLDFSKTSLTGKTTIYAITISKDSEEIDDCEAESAGCA